MMELDLVMRVGIGAEKMPWRRMEQKKVAVRQFDSRTKIVIDVVEELKDRKYVDLVRGLDMEADNEFLLMLDEEDIGEKYWFIAPKDEAETLINLMNYNFLFETKKGHRVYAHKSLR